MIKRYYRQFKNHIQILKLLICHLLYKFRFKNFALIIFSLIFCLFIIFPMYLISEIYGYNIEIIETITYYLLVILWIMCIIISFRSNILQTIEENLTYCYDLLNLLNDSYFLFINRYEKYINIKKQMNKEYDDTFKYYNYDNYVINITFIEIFKLYFLNINNSIKNNQFLCVNTEILSQLEKENNINDFYNKILFNYNNSSDGIQKENKLYIYIMDKITYKLLNKPWFPEYFKNADIYGLIKYIIQIWVYHIIKYSKFSIEEDKEILNDIKFELA